MKLTNQEKEEIIDLFKKGYSANDLAKMFNISTTNVVFILKKIGYKRERIDSMRLKKLINMNNLINQYKKTKEIKLNKDLRFILQMKDFDREKIRNFLVENYKMDLIDQDEQEKILDNIIYFKENYVEVKE
ncbi:MAG: hypothetical protein QXG86_03775 [Candidatus Woesearchaeota archaeon]